MSSSMGKLLIIAGIAITLAGVAILFKDHLPFMKYLGRLPGDISVQRKNFSFHFPVVTCIIVSIIGSIVLSLILYLINKLK